MAPNHSLPIWGNDKTMNLNTLVLTNIQSSPYFKVQLFDLKTFHEVVDEIYYRVDHLEPWEKGSRKTAGQTGMCGGVRGVGAGGIVSSAYCLLFKLCTLKLTKKQINNLITHSDSPYIRGLGFMYIRYTQPPQDLWDWYEPYLDDDENASTSGQNDELIISKWLEIIGSLPVRIPQISQHTPQSFMDASSRDVSAVFHTQSSSILIRPEAHKEVDVKAGGGHMMMIGEMLRQWLVKLDWYATLFPRIPVPIQKDIDFKLRSRPSSSGYNGFSSNNPQVEEQEPEHIPDDQVSFGEAERAVLSQRGRGAVARGPTRSDYHNGNSHHHTSRRHSPHRSPSRQSHSKTHDFSRDLERERERQRSRHDKHRSVSHERKRSRSRDRKRSRSRSQSKNKHRSHSSERKEHSSHHHHDKERRKEGKKSHKHKERHKDRRHH